MRCAKNSRADFDVRCGWFVHPTPVSLRLSALHERVDRCETGEPAEIPISCKKLRHAVRQTQRRDPRIVHAGPRNASALEP